MISISVQNAVCKNDMYSILGRLYEEVILGLSSIECWVLFVSNMYGKFCLFVACGTVLLFCIYALS